LLTFRLLNPRAPRELPRLMRAFLLAFTLFGTAALHAAESLDFTPVKKWIARQEDFRAVTADFVQTRSLRALRNPLKSEGRLWFKAPSSFRWELGQPAKTIVLRKGDFIYIIQPEKKRAERSPAGAANQQSGAAALAMMEFPFARDFADFQKRFETLSIETEGARCRLAVLPRDARARKMLNALKLDFSTATGHLLAFEIATRDGSSLRNEFSNVEVNPKIDPSVFDFDLSGYEIVDAKH
jgi:outer membrane lipoprotein-sorting protein